MQVARSAGRSPSAPAVAVTGLLGTEHSCPRLNDKTPPMRMFLFLFSRPLFWTWLSCASFPDSWWKTSGVQNKGEISMHNLSLPVTHAYFFPGKFSLVLVKYVTRTERSRGPGLIIARLLSIPYTVITCCLYSSGVTSRNGSCCEIPF